MVKKMNGELLAAIEKKQSTAKKTTKELIPAVGATANNNAGETCSFLHCETPKNCCFILYAKIQFMAVQRT